MLIGVSVTTFELGVFYYIQYRVSFKTVLSSLGLKLYTIVKIQSKIALKTSGISLAMIKVLEYMAL